MSGWQIRYVFICQYEESKITYNSLHRAYRKPRGMGDGRGYDAERAINPLCNTKFQIVCKICKITRGLPKKGLGIQAAAEQCSLQFSVQVAEHQYYLA